MYCGSIILFLLCIVRMIFADESSLYLEEIRSLSELPIDKLIQIKSSLGSGNDITNTSETENEEINASSRTIPAMLPMALPLKKSKKPTRRYEDHYHEKDKDTKISKIFQLTITALSFLAFGGYLLTLIISAIRRNSSGGNNGNNLLIFSNLQNLQKLSRPKRNVLIFDSMENNFETDKLYEGMIMLSRSYALYN